MGEGLGHFQRFEPYHLHGHSDQETTASTEQVKPLRRRRDSGE